MPSEFSVQTLVVTKIEGRLGSNGHVYRLSPRYSIWGENTVAQGIRKMKRIARSNMWWPGIDRSIEDLVKSCVDCQPIGKAPLVAPLQTWEWRSRAFQLLHI